MSDKEAVSFTVILGARWFREPAHVKIYIDDELVEDTNISAKYLEDQNQTFMFTRELTEGDHELSIQYLDKAMSDTKIDEDGNILDDHLLHIFDIEIDEVSLGYIAHKNGVYHVDKEFYAECEDIPAVINEMTTIGFNGIWRLKFQVPTYIWLLENL
jgi:hypothetical protein